MIRFSCSGIFYFLGHIALMLSLAMLINQEYNPAFVFFIILVFLFTESIIRSLWLYRKKANITCENSTPFLLTHVNQDISLFFSAEKELFKHKKPAIYKLSITPKKLKTEWADNHILKLTLNVSKPACIKLKNIRFTEMDLIHLHTVNYVHCEQNQSIIFLPEPIRNREIEHKINNMGHKTKNRDYILGLRDYQPGDKFKDINWKQSSKQGTFQVNQFYAKDKPSVTLCIDTVTDKSSDKKAMNLLLKNITHLVLYSPYRKYIKKVIMNDTVFILNKDKQLFFETLVMKKRIFFKKKLCTIQEQPDMLVITTRKNLNIRNCIVVEKK